MSRRTVIALFFSTIIICCFCCKQDAKIMEGDLYFPLFHIGSFYGVPDSLIQKVKLSMDTVNVNNADSSDRKFIEMYAVLKKRALLYSPFVSIKLDRGTTVLLYLDKKDYDKLKIYHHKELQNEHKKIRIKFSAQSLQYQMYLCKSLINIDKIDGVTEARELKLQVEDYY